MEYLRKNPLEINKIRQSKGETTLNKKNKGIRQNQ